MVEIKYGPRESKKYKKWYFLAFFGLLNFQLHNDTCQASQYQICCGYNRPYSNCLKSWAKVWIFGIFWQIFVNEVKFFRTSQRIKSFLLRPDVVVLSLVHIRKRIPNFQMSIDWQLPKNVISENIFPF